MSLKRNSTGTDARQAGTPGLRVRNLYDPSSAAPYKLSRSKLELFLQCPRCFYLDRRKGVGQPSGPAFTLNVAVDALLKREFDAHRKRGSPHELMTEFGIDAVPYAHPDLDSWRDNFHGVQALHEPSGFLFYGAIDDLWQSPGGDLHVVDYKATSTQREITLDGPWKQAYKRQMEMYQWLLRRSGLPVADTGYFVFVNGQSGLEKFGGRLEFQMQIIPYRGDAGWVEDALLEAKVCLSRDLPPAGSRACEWCAYRREASKIEWGEEW